jgi:hypothetical protein
MALADVLGGNGLQDWKLVGDRTYGIRLRDPTTRDQEDGSRSGRFTAADRCQLEGVREHLQGLRLLFVGDANSVYVDLASSLAH